MSSIALDGIAGESTIVLYEPAGGQIVHVHHVVTMNGGTHPDAEALERGALAALSRIHPGAKVLALEVPPDTFARERLVRVDPGRRVLVDLPVQPRQRPGLRIP
jgi:hypothetical protein